ncbi:MAG: ABC transporter substrate-binding protein [bacterium]|nr:ABC transporter substrate-binding protein [bacterium]
MKHLKSLLVGAILVLAAALLVAPVVAQDGGIVIEGNLGGDPATFNPITASDTASRRVTGFLYPGFVGTDPAQAVIVPDAPGALVQDWSISEDGTVYTFTLRQDLAWSDGTPVTSADVIYTWEAIQAGAQGIVDTPLSFVIDPTRETGILSVEAPDDYTVVVTFASAECTALNNAGVLYPAPSHVLPADVAGLNDAEFNLNPTVSGGVFLFSEFRPGEQVALVRNDNYSDAPEGGVGPAGYIYVNLPDQNVLVESFLAGETNVIDGPAVARRAEIRAAADEGRVQNYDYPGNAWDYLAFNLADPNNPQNGLDEAGNPIDQGNHPIFGDVRVRQAIAQAVDVDAIVDAAVFGEGERMTSFIIPASWAYNTELPPIAFDQAAAIALLEEAGWIDDDNDPTTPRVAQGAMFVEDGTPLTFTLYTNEGNTRREAVGTVVQDYLAQVGIQVDFQTIDFNTLLDIMDSQTFDTFILGWRNGYPDDPDATQLFSPASDVVGAGSNNTSYSNAEFMALNDQAKSLPGCDPAERAPLYGEMQAIFQQDLPYLPLFAINGNYAASASVTGFDPYPSQLFWNVDTWTVSTP